MTLVPFALSCTLLPSKAKWYTYSSSTLSPRTSVDKPKCSALRYLSLMASCTPALQHLLRTPCSRVAHPLATLQNLRTPCSTQSTKRCALASLLGIRSLTLRPTRSSRLLGCTDTRHWLHFSSAPSKRCSKQLGCAIHQLAQQGAPSRPAASTLLKYDGGKMPRRKAV